MPIPNRDIRAITPRTVMRKAGGEVAISTRDVPAIKVEIACYVCVFMYVLCVYYMYVV